MMKPRVAFLSVVPSPYQRDMYVALSRREDLDLSVFYLEEESPDSPWPRKPLASYERILPGFWIPAGSARVHLNWRLPRFRHYDLLVLNTLMSATAQFIMRFRLRNLPWIFWGERLSTRTGPGSAMHSLLTSPLACAAGIASIGTRALADYQARFPIPKHFCIPYYCELAPFFAAPRQPCDSAGELVFLFCGQMIERKGIDLLLAAFERHVGAGARIRLLLAGREAGLPPLLSRLSFAARERIEYAGFLPPEELPLIFARADVFILPSRYDGWGVVVNQALGAGLALLCSDATGAAADLVEEGVNGITFTSGDTNALFNAMDRFIKTPRLAAEWGAESRKKAAQWEPAIGAQKWADAIHSILPVLKT